MKRAIAVLSIGVMMLAWGAAAAAPVPDQVIATWTETDTDSHTENTLAIAKGTLTSTSILYDKVYPKGDKTVLSVKLARIKKIGGDMLTHADMAKMAMPGDKVDNSDTPAVYRIGVEAKGDHDITDSSFGGRMVDHTGHMPGFASFPAVQKDQIAAAYKTLCALMAPGICDQ